MPTKTATLTQMGKHYELSDRNLIIFGDAGELHELVTTTVLDILTEYQLRTRSGRAFAETQFTLRRERTRIPDVAWLTERSLRRIPRIDRAIAVAPDLAIEIISDFEQAGETGRKLRDYLDAGVEVWQVWPSISCVMIWRGRSGTRLEGEDILTSEKLPGLAIRVSDMFRL